MVNTWRWRGRMEWRLLQRKTEHHHKMFEEIIIFLFYVYDLTVCGPLQLGTRKLGTGNPVSCSPLHRSF